MTAEQFVYWLQGYIEIDKPDIIPLNQTKIIKDHLALVFDKKTPEREEEKESGINLVYDRFSSPIFPGNVNEDIRTKKICSTIDYSYDPRSMPENWSSSGNLTSNKVKRVKEDTKNKKSQIKC